MEGVKGIKPFDIDLASHVCRRCVARWLERTVSPLSLTFISYTYDKTYQSRLHILPTNIEVVSSGPPFCVVVM
jgi:hypothetical protein